MDRSRTKLVCTIGPATAERIGELVAAGMDVARINFSHGTPDEHRAYVHAVRAAAHSARRSVAVMADLPGPKIRLGRLRDDAVTLETGATFVLRPRRSTSASGPAETPAEGDSARDDAGHAEMASPERSADAAAEAVVSDASPAQLTADPGTGAAAGLSVDSAQEEIATQAEVVREAASEDVTQQSSEAVPEAISEAPVELSEVSASRAAASESALVTEPARPAELDEEQLGDATGAAVSEPGLGAQLQVGDRVLLADGAAELRVTAVSESEVTTLVVNGGTIRSRTGVNIPSERLAATGLTDADRASVPRALELRVDLIAQSFVRGADDVKALRALLPAEGPRIVAKIETRAAVDSFDEIVTAADGIMVARGDLGVDIPFEDVPLIQKDLIRRATGASRFSIVATQMLESMTAAPRPTRAEASDVANAVLDGTDAVMLSAETAIGEFPVDALRAMARICTTTEANGPRALDHSGVPAPRTPSDSIIAAARFVAESGQQDGPTAIWCFTRSGRTAELLSLQRPGIPIVAFTLNPIVARRLAVRSGVVPMVLSGAGPRGEPLLDRMSAAWRAQRSRTDFATVILVTTSRQPGGINRLEVHSISQPTSTKATAATH